ncbi:hypothetical protein ELE36_18960 [Pseudolysobacter antarcticus]|uniref:Uncharacterized protein n=1 Tax=Pseudolysobacter antarcticus TaxID=2511995 RepID=A0A411HPD6_9GAMM|nr:hypothetical protein [Pseudolysobacter antarcticus]QBB72280.1 hypothetical protein ELE36_18960 [Pseudolysobacter antarcticus]
MLTVQNASATAILGHVTVWSDQGVPAADFNIYLTGYDLQSFSMRDVLNGTLPQTASAGQDPGDVISPKGPLSQDINFASCTSQLPNPAGSIPAPVGMTPADLRKALTGVATTGISSGMCWGRAIGDNHARGYVTVDTVNNCTLNTPADAGYMTNDITFQNVMLGSYFLVNAAQNFMLADSAVQIEASFNDPLVNTSGNYTFYGRYDGWNASDRRESLPKNWGVQGETDTSSLLVWRDSKTSETPHACNVDPTYAPLGQEGMTFFGTDSKPSDAVQGLPFVPGSALPVASQFVPFTAAAFGAPARKLGFLFMNLNTTVVPAGSNPPADPAASQSFVTVSRKGIGALNTAAGNSAVSLDLNGFTHYVPGH